MFSPPRANEVNVHQPRNHREHAIALFVRVRVQPLIALAPWCLRLKLNHGDLVVMHEAKIPRRADIALESFGSTPANTGKSAAYSGHQEQQRENNQRDLSDAELANLERRKRRMSAQAQARAWLDWSITIPLTVRRAHHYELRRSLNIESLLGHESIPAYPSSHTPGLAEFKDDHHNQSGVLCRV